MAILMGNATIKKKDFSFDESKVEKHEVKPTGLELILSHDRMGSSFIELDLKDYGKRITIEYFTNVFGDDVGKQQEPTPKQLEPIEKRYNEITGMLERGEYVLHLYGNGKVEIEFLGEKREE